MEEKKQGWGVFLNDEAMSHGQEWHIRKILLSPIEGRCVGRSQAALKE